MSEVTTRPPAGATKASPRRNLASRTTHPGGAPHPPPDSTPTAPARSEGDTLALQAAEILQTLVMYVIYDGTDGPRDLKNSHLSYVDHLLGRLLEPTFHERDPSDPAEGNILDHLAAIDSELKEALGVLERTAEQDERVGLFLQLSATAQAAFDYSGRLFTAYKNLPASLENLRALTTYAGARPFRDQPRPPIRRAEPAPSEPGHIYSAKDTRAVFIEIAGQAGTLRDFLASASHICEESSDKLLSSNNFRVGENLAAFIAAVADQMIGHAFTGGAAEWSVNRVMYPIGGAA